MKILVTAKRVIDAYVKIRVKSDHSGIETANVKMSMNPFDEIAVEEAVRLKEKNLATEVVVVSIGPQHTQETLRQALALGADKAILVEAEQSLAPLNIAKILQHIIQREAPQLVLMGKQSIDGDNNQTGQMLAALLDWPQATFASKIDVNNDNAEVTREIDGGLETLALTLPAIVTTDLRLNEPRYASLPNIMKAKKKPLEVLALNDLNLELRPHIETLKVEPPAKRSAGIKVSSVQELIEKLKADAVI